MSSDGHSQGKKWPDPRHFHRDQSHQASHSQLDAQTLGPILAHPLASPEPPVSVTSPAALAEMIAHLRSAGSFAFDSEFIGERSYEPCLCLVQAATTKRVFLVDPLAELDLADFWQLIVDPSVEKMVLAGQQDLCPAALDTQQAPANILDVQIAAGFVHVDYPLSLIKLLKEFVGAEVGKALTFTHWDQRPLSAVQVRYAADDVRYLPAAREAIGRRLADAGRAAWAKEECTSVLEDRSLYLPTPETLYLRVRRRESLGRRQLAVLRELAVVRDQGAREENVPTRTWLKDSILVAMARHPARDLKDLDAVRGLPRPVESRYGPRIIEAAARAMALPEDQLPPAEPSEPMHLKGRVDALMAAVGQFCLERSISPALVASRKELARLCQATAAGASADQHRLLRGWRKEFLGELLDKLL